ncbi:MAG: riboflavin synthase [Bacteroidetes bacterium]|nr:riboflavin synthase [Bacteroidota bacterium]
MFTGIIETIGEVRSLKKEGDNLHIEIISSLTPELKVDQSIALNGVCLTVVKIKEESYVVTAIKETIDKTNIRDLVNGNLVNLERAMKLGDYLDGHLVQGHIDQTGVCKEIVYVDGSHYFTFQYNDEYGNITIEKGSITINGVSLTVVNSKENEFSVAIIPYTYDNTNFKELKINIKVNLEFDIVGKYLKKLMKRSF